MGSNFLLRYNTIPDQAQHKYTSACRKRRCQEIMKEMPRHGRGQFLGLPVLEKATCRTRMIISIEPSSYLQYNDVV